ncbi:DUF4369 domain-containing protein [Flavobacteriaceae bacterium SZ-1-7]|uniref:DUF4369 domain-containing protein n=1 Tax=Tamlana sedimenti TaxID=3134126 RepID=UPI003125FB8E
MQRISILLLALIIIGCSNNQNDLTVKVNIKDLKKGTVYLKKTIDTNLVTMDSIVINGNPTFELYSPIDTPEVFFLYLDKNSTVEDRISFFADKGITEINTTLKNFVFDAKINGSAQQKTLEEYRSIISKINDRKLDLIKETFDAQRDGDSVKIDSLEKESKNILKRKYLYTINFAISHGDSEVAPYLALTEIYDAKFNFLDTINKSLTPKIKESKYGKELNEFIEQIKINENIE